MKGHALRRQIVQTEAQEPHYAWTCECGHSFGEQPTMSVHRVRKAHRDHKAAVAVPAA